MLYKFELGRNPAKAAKNICCMKGESAVYHSAVTKRFKKFYWDCKNLDDQTRSARPKTVDSEVVLSICK